MKSRIAKLVIICFIMGSAVAQGAVNCNVVSASLNFGTYDPITSLTDKTVLGDIQINCNGAVAVTIRLAVGQGTFSSRTMSSSGHTVKYNVYADAGYTQVWGDGTSGTVTVPFTFSEAGPKPSQYTAKFRKARPRPFPEPTPRRRKSQSPGPVAVSTGIIRHLVRIWKCQCCAHGL